MDSIVPAARKAYNLEQMTSIDTSGGTVRELRLIETMLGQLRWAGGNECLTRMHVVLQMIVTEVGECPKDSNDYLHPKSGKVVSINHVDKVRCCIEAIAGDTLIVAARWPVQLTAQDKTQRNGCDCIVCSR